MKISPVKFKGIGIIFLAKMCRKYAKENFEAMRTETFRVILTLRIIAVVGREATPLRHLKPYCVIFGWSAILSCRLSRQCCFSLQKMHFEMQI